MPELRSAAICLLSVALGTAALIGQETPSIQDNSFLMEEAYNQEEGIVQHINSFQRLRGGDWLASFTQEWPVPKQAHQLSYTVLYTRVDSDTISHTGLGDVALNYRYQLAGSGESKFACAPRVSVLLPTGDQRRDLGSGGVGFQVNVAMSTVLSEKLVMHTNIGGTWNPRAKDAANDTAATLGWNLGQSFIWLARNDLNFLVETIWNEAQAVVGDHQASSSHVLTVSPGIRWAWNRPGGGLQIVPGIAVPIAIGANRTETSIFVYLSFEHEMWKGK
jgi:hypothetical protein